MKFVTLVYSSFVPERLGQGHVWERVRCVGWTPTSWIDMEKYTFVHIYIYVYIERARERYTYMVIT